MCEPTTIAIAVAAAQVAGGVMQGVQGMSAAKANAAAMRQQGAQEYQAALAESNNLRYSGERRMSELTARQGASGAALDSGSYNEVAGQQAQNIELDAMRVMYGGVLKKNALYHQALVTNKMARAEAANTILGSVISAATTAIGGGVFDKAAKPPVPKAFDRATTASFFPKVG